MNFHRLYSYFYIIFFQILLLINPLLLRVSCIPCYRVFIKYCVFSKILRYTPDSGLSRFLLGAVSVCVHSVRSNPSACSKTDRVQKSHKIQRKNTMFNEHPVYSWNKIRLCKTSWIHLGMDSATRLVPAIWLLLGGNKVV